MILKEILGGPGPNPRPPFPPQGPGPNPRPPFPPQGPGGPIRPREF